MRKSRVPESNNVGGRSIHPDSIRLQYQNLQIIIVLDIKSKEKHVRITEQDVRLKTNHALPPGDYGQLAMAESN